ncbi:MAG: hypothetical protein A2925_00730 [Candidatus Yanofskybacteria bacterium RIFCSPLOWO2_01_FULL_44_22]|uniref:Uncharacterized protein n=1 Tax=Candidatus Yanofskybacteria bacterium RIFCSPLOWO2_01_FULL_44_22 TaxID=1802697 RepID=A0A1F8GIZ1_9BACT|nr:MAG: hypothetical protein A2925_00730 [Candidatus Yanofskybacteria bacterium RIFCSPLOWO2_01_FULL_44_22]
MPDLFTQFPSQLPTGMPNIFLSVSPIILWSAFGFLFAFALIMGAIMMYHYKNFSLEPVRSFFLMMVYVIVWGGLTLAALGGINLYLNSL